MDKVSIANVLFSFALILSFRRVISRPTSKDSAHIHDKPYQHYLPIHYYSTYYHFPAYFHAFPSLKCPEPVAPTNGSFHGSGSHSGFWGVGSSCFYHCDEGFIMGGTDSVVCQTDGTWSDDVPTCTQVSSNKTCPVPPNVDHGAFYSSGVVDGSYVPGAKYQYTCINGYHLLGEAIAVCGEDGQWSQPTPSCFRTFQCPTPIRPHYGFVFPRKAMYVPGDMIYHTCVKGYKVEGTVVAHCTGTGKWSAPPAACTKERVCNAPKSAPANCKMSSPPNKQHWVEGEKIHYKCSRGYKLHGMSTNICGRNGKWIGKQPICVPPPIQVIEYF